MRALSFCVRRAAALAVVGVAAASPNQAEPVIQADAFVVAEAPLAADARGTSAVRLSEIAPVATRSLATVAAQVANLQVNASGAGSFGTPFSLRGLSNTPYFSDPSVAVYFDDLPLGSAFTYPTDLFGFAAISVARGLQLTGGRAAEGGTITFSSAVPGPHAAAALRFGAGNYRARLAALDVSSARGELVDATVSAAVATRDGFIQNSTLGRRVDDQRGASAAARLRLRPTATTEVTLQFLGHRRRDGSQPLVPTGGPLFTVQRDREGSTESDFGGGALKLAADTAAGRLSATTSYTRWTLDPYDNRLILPPPLDSRLSQRQTTWNEELRLTSAAKSFAPWVVGAWFSDTETAGNVNRSIPGLFPIEASQFTLHARTAAVFGEATIPISTGWSIVTAVRAEETRKEFDRSQRVPFPARLWATDRLQSLMPKVTATFDVNPGTHASAAVGFGVKPGGWSAYTDNPSLAGFDPEKATTFEVGIDTLVARRTVKLAARAFNYEVRDYQIERSFTATDYIVVNAPRARSFGAEFEAAWRVRPGFTVTATLGLTHLTLLEFTDPFTGRNQAGRRAPYAPDYDAHLGVVYRSRVGWFVAADVTAVGRTFYEEAEDPRSASRAHALLNAEVGYENERWRIAAHSENLTDARYATLVIPGIGHEVPGAPRTYGLEATVKW